MTDELTVDHEGTAASRGPSPRPRRPHNPPSPIASPDGENPLSRMGTASGGMQVAPIESDFRGLTRGPRAAPTVSTKSAVLRRRPSDSFSSVFTAGSVASLQADAAHRGVGLPRSSQLWRPLPQQEHDHAVMRRDGARSRSWARTVSSLVSPSRHDSDASTDAEVSALEKHGPPARQSLTTTRASPANRSGVLLTRTKTSAPPRRCLRLGSAFSTRHPSRRPSTISSDSRMATSASRSWDQTDHAFTYRDPPLPCAVPMADRQRLQMGNPPAY